MSEKELRRVEVLARVASGELRLRDAAVLLRVSYRQASAWLGVPARGSCGPAAWQRGTGGPIAASQRSCASRCWLWCARSIPATAQTLVDAGAEHLAEEDGLLVHGNAAPLDAEKTAVGPRPCQPREHRKRRRARTLGELVQLDGSFHQWFEQRGPHGCLMNMVDDASGVTHAWIGRRRNHLGRRSRAARWIKSFGVPLALYTDWKTSTKQNPTASRTAWRKAPDAVRTHVRAVGNRHHHRQLPAARPRGTQKRRASGRFIKKNAAQTITSYVAANAYLENICSGEQPFRARSRRRTKLSSRHPQPGPVGTPTFVCKPDAPSATIGWCVTTDRWGSCCPPAGVRAAQKNRCWSMKAKLVSWK